MSLGNCKELQIKTKMRNYHTPIWIVKIQNWQHQMQVKMWGKNSHLLLMGIQKGTATLEDTMAVSYQEKHKLTIWSSDHVPRFLYKWGENLCPRKNLHMNVYNSFTYNCQKWEAMKMSFNSWMNKQAVVYPYNNIFINTKKWTIKSQKTWRFPDTGFGNDVF